jgi:hypothetical protein
MKLCTLCGEEIHPKRLEILPSATQCVKCSTTGKKAGVTVVVGEGDHTYNDVVIMDREEYDQYRELESRLYGKRKDDLSHPDDEEVEIEEEDKIDELEGVEEVKNIDIEDLED